MPALFIGRFQPFHKGHLDALTKIIKENDLTYVGIGSTDENEQELNPFTCAERYEMIELALTNAQIPLEKFRIIPVPNIANFTLWPQHIETYIPPFEKIYTGSPIVAQLFTDYNRKLKTPYEIVRIEKTLPVSATKIRAQILSDGNWEEMVSQTTAKLIRQWNGIQRIKQIQ